jgi:hypothetical protein
MPKYHGDPSGTLELRHVKISRETNAECPALTRVCHGAQG